MAVLAMAFAAQEASETAFASTAVAGHKAEREFHLAKVKEQRDKQYEIDHGPGLFSSLFKLVADAFKNVLAFDASGLLSDLGRDLEPLVTSKALWSDLQAVGRSVAKIAVAVGAAALAGLSLGTASVPAIVVAALVLSTSSAVVGETKCLDGILGEGWSDRIAAALGAASAVVTGGASALAIASAGTSLAGVIVRDTKMFGDASAWVGLGMSLSSGALGLGASVVAADRAVDAAGQGTSQATKTLEHIDAAAAGASCGGKTLEGLGGSQAARLDYKMALSKIDEKAAQTASESTRQQSRWAMENMQQVVTHLLRSREVLCEVVAAEAQNGRVATRAWS
jgi:hypothetical protein